MPHQARADVVRAARGVADDDVAPAVSGNRVPMRQEVRQAARQRRPPDTEILGGEVSQVMLHELEHPCPPTIISKSGLIVRFWGVKRTSRGRKAMSADDPKMG